MLAPLDIIPGVGGAKKLVTAGRVNRLHTLTDIGIQTKKFGTSIKNTIGNTVDIARTEGLKRLNQAKEFVKTQAKLQIDDVKLVIKTANDKANEFAEWAGSLLFRQDNVAMQGAGGGIVKIDSGVDVVKGAGNSGVTKGTGQDFLSTNGSFIDSKSESNYENYLARKAKEGKPPKDRLEWKEARDYWLNDSPMARGNKFNKTVRKRRIYNYHEIHLENGKRLDSYDPIAKEIISRKATDLDMIDEKTYRAYLKEMDQKYSAGTKIRSNRYPELDGRKLEGELILEIPASNKNLPEIERYKQIAKEYGIKLRFMEE